MVDGTHRLDSVEATVVIGEDQPLIRDGDPRTAASEDDDRVSDAGLIQRIEGVDGQTEAKLLHLRNVLLRELVEEPHPLVGTCLYAQRERSDTEDKSLAK